jgi:ABC-type transport system substrate-binding protein
MEKKTMDTLRGMICGELEDIVKKGSLSHESLDVLKDLVETEKNLMKIKRYDAEEKQKEQELEMMGNSYDRGYSQRKYYIDADYQPYDMNSYRNNYMMGNSYGGNQGMYAMNGGNSYAPYDMSYTQNGGGYSRHGDKNEMMMELQKMMRESTDDKTREAIQKTMTELNK